MFSTHNAASQLSQSPCEERKVEVSIEAGADGEQVVLRYLTWTEGLGWCGQKTIRLDDGHLDELHRALTVARHRINRRKAEAGRPAEMAKVIQMPVVA